MPDSRNREYPQLSLLALILSWGIFPAFLAAYLYTHGTELLNLCERSGDYALILLETARAGAGETLLGPYSRYGFRHPGPLMFYVYAAGEPFIWFTRTAQASYSVIQLLLNVYFTSCALRAARILLPDSRAATLLLISVILFFREGSPTIWYDIWGPSTVVAPILAVLFSGWAVTRGNYCHVFPLLSAALIAGSNHIGTLAISLPLLLTVAVETLRQKRPRSRSKLESLGFLAALLLILACASFFVVEIATAYPKDNLHRMADFFLSPERKSQQLSDVILYVAGFLTKPFFGAGLGTSAGKLIGATIILGTPWIFAAHNRDTSLLRVLILLAVLFMIAGALKIDGTLHRYLMRYGFAIGAAAFFLFLLSLVRMLPDRKSTLLVLTSGVVIAIYTGMLQPPRASRCTERYSLLVDRLQLSAETLHQLSMTRHEAWKGMARIAVELYRRGIPFCVDQTWWHIFGADLTCDSVRQKPEYKAAPQSLLTLGAADRQKSDATRTVSYGSTSLSVATPR